MRETRKLRLVLYHITALEYTARSERDTLRGLGYCNRPRSCNSYLRIYTVVSRVREPGEQLLAWVSLIPGYLRQRLHSDVTIHEDGRA